MIDAPFQVERFLYSFYQATSIQRLLLINDKGGERFSLCVSPPPPWRCSLTWCRGDGNYGNNCNDGIDGSYGNCGITHRPGAEAMAIMAMMATMATIATMVMMAVMAIMALLTDLVQRRHVNLPVPTAKHSAIFLGRADCYQQQLRK